MALSLLFLIASTSLALGEFYRPLQRASSKPVNVDHKLDCALKELAWDYAKKLLPWQGSFQSAYDALQLSSCDVSLSSGRRYPLRPFQSQSRPEADSIEIFVSTAGDDSSPGTMTRPVKTVTQALRLYRLKSRPGSGGIVYLRAGTYYLSEPVALGPEDSNLEITAYQDELVTISGGKVYEFTWEEVVNEMGPLMEGVSAIGGAVSVAGESNKAAMFYGKLASASECRAVCINEVSCFAFTWHDSTMGDFANMCYFRVDGLWVRTLEKGTSSGKKLHIVSADLSSQNPTPFTSLFLNGRRAVRARYPDGNPETMGLHTDPTGYVSEANSWLPPASIPVGTEIFIESPQRNGTHFPKFSLGIGGPVSAFSPPESYWGTKSPTGGGGSTYKIVTGLTYSKDEDFVDRMWKRPETGVVHAFHCFHWGNWLFQLSGRDYANRELTFAYGGWQEARGCSVGTEWFVENIKEELDAPGEWYYDDLEMKLYFFPNGSSTPPSSGVATVLYRLFEVYGCQDKPVYNITITNLVLTQTAPTYLERYEVPSGGDWGIHRGGAVFAEGVDGFLVQNCLFDSPGGNGVFLSNYVRNAVIEANEFVYVGDSAIAAVGTADLMDGTSGNQPRGSKIIGNLMHEIGIFGKQTSAYFQSVACQTQLIGNVLFNGPRAGINFNDGFGGGNLVKSNLAFNMVRETADHGSFNSWDRQPYLTKVKDGSSSLTPAQTNITRNFFINSYHSVWPIDHDDGSCYYYDTYNYLVYGGYKNYIGHSKVAKYNYYIYPDASHVLDFISRPFCANSDKASTGNLPSGWGEIWANNTCIIGNPDVYRFSSCKVSGDITKLVPFTFNNMFYAPAKDVYFQCEKKNYSMLEWQIRGYDIGSTVSNLVDTATIIDWGRKVLEP